MYEVLYYITARWYYLNIHNFQGYEFKRWDHAKCSISVNKYEAYYDATKACEDDKQCEGIVYDICNNENQISLCMKGSTLLANPDIESCVYMKHKIGKSDRLKSMLHQISMVVLYKL